jgi:hypothetical protein
VSRYDQQLERISGNISTLSGAKASSIQVRDTASSTGFRQTISTTELRLSQKRIDVEETNRKAIQAKREVAADSLQKYKLQILEIQNNSAVAGELGPLQYLSGLTGTPMDKIINILLLVIIFVFDPLAISMVVAANFAFDKANQKNLYDEYEDEVEEDLWNDDPWEGPSEAQQKEAEDQYELHDIEVASEIVEAPEDWKVVDENDQPIPDKIPIQPKPKKILQKGPSKHRVLFNDGTTRKVSKDDNIIRYL